MQAREKELVDVFRGAAGIVKTPVQVSVVDLRCSASRTVQAPVQGSPSSGSINEALVPPLPAADTVAFPQFLPPPPSAPGSEVTAPADGAVAHLPVPLPQATASGDSSRCSTAHKFDGPASTGSGLAANSGLCSEVAAAMLQLQQAWVQRKKDAAVADDFDLATFAKNRAGHWEAQLAGIPTTVSELQTVLGTMNNEAAENALPVLDLVGRALQSLSDAASVGQHALSGHAVRTQAALAGLLRKMQDAWLARKRCHADAEEYVEAAFAQKRAHHWKTVAEVDAADAAAAANLFQALREESYRHKCDVGDSLDIVEEAVRQWQRACAAGPVSPSTPSKRSMSTEGSAALLRDLTGRVTASLRERMVAVAAVEEFEAANSLKQQLVQLEQTAAITPGTAGDAETIVLQLATAIGSDDTELRERLRQLEEAFAAVLGDFVGPAKCARAK